MKNCKLVSKEEYIKELIDRANYHRVCTLCVHVKLRHSATIKELREALMKIENKELMVMGSRLFYELLRYRIEIKINNEEV